MQHKNMLKFLNTLEKEGELIRIKQFINPELEISEITDRVSKSPGGGKAILFENTGTEFPLLINSLGSERRICLALGINNLDETSEKLAKLFNKLTATKSNFWEKLKLLPTLKEISSWLPVYKNGKGACQEI
jgi:4-hydroxy-3-polyprenylbenzoate decarboxylase